MARPRKDVGEALTIAVKDLLNNNQNIADVGTVLGVLGQDTTRWLDNLKRECSSIDELKEVYGQAYKALSKDKAAVDMISKAKDVKKGELA